MTTKDDRRERLIAEAREAQGLGDREKTRELLEQLAELDKPEKAVPAKSTETRRAKKKP
jgi:hypothetical protein